MIKAQEFVFR